MAQSRLSRGPRAPNGNQMRRQRGSSALRPTMRTARAQSGRASTHSHHSIRLGHHQQGSYLGRALTESHSRNSLRRAQTSTIDRAASISTCLRTPRRKLEHNKRAKSSSNFSQRQVPAWLAWLLFRMRPNMNSKFMEDKLEFFPKTRPSLSKDWTLQNWDMMAPEHLCKQVASKDQPKVRHKHQSLEQLASWAAKTPTASPSRTASNTKASTSSTLTSASSQHSTITATLAPQLPIENMMPHQTNRNTISTFYTTLLQSPQAPSKTIWSNQTRQQPLEPERKAIKAKWQIPIKHCSLSSSNLFRMSIAFSWTMCLPVQLRRRTRHGHSSIWRRRLKRWDRFNRISKDRISLKMSRILKGMPRTWTLEEFWEQQV